MNLSKIKKLYNLISTSENISEIRANLHRECDHINFDQIASEYVTSKDVLMMINYIKKEYESMIDAEKNAYRISDDELQNRINKLKKVDEIYKSTNNPFIRFDKMSKLFKNPSIMHKSYILLIRYGKDDERLDEIRPLLKNFDNYYREYRDNYKNEIHKFVANAYYEEDINDNKEYANFIISEYIKSFDSYKDKEFLNKYGIDKEIFASYVKVIQESDSNLYKDYLIKKQRNTFIEREMTAHTINDLAFAINNGYFVYGNRFDLLEFIKQVPFKNSTNFLEEIESFMDKHNQAAKNIIINYIKYNNLDKENCFKKYNIDNLYNSVLLIEGHSIEKEDIAKVLTYLDSRNIPLCKASLAEACKMYLNNRDNFILGNLKERNDYQPILIPKARKKDAI